MSGIRGPSLNSPRATYVTTIKADEGASIKATFMMRP